jgi:hypothetical protein
LQRKQLLTETNICIEARYVICAIFDGVAQQAAAEAIGSPRVMYSLAVSFQKPVSAPCDVGVEVTIGK